MNAAAMRPAPAARAVLSPVPAATAAEPVPPLLSVSDLAVSFGPIRALDGVNLSVAEGEIVALAGENGAGKTTLVRCIGGDIEPSAGVVRLSGKVMPSDPGVLARHGIGVVWQDLALCDNLDIAANLMLGREHRRQLRSDVRMHTDAMRLLERLSIPLRDTSRSVRSLSGGQRQLVAVARAVARSPRVLLLDEPTAALGVQIAREVENMIIAMRAEGTAILLACHDIDQMFRLADRIVILRHGRVAAEVRPDEVHPDDVVALLSGQQVGSTARRQLTRLHGLADELVSADPSSSLSLILSALGAALGSERLCIHLLDGDSLACAASLGLPADLQAAWARLPCGPAGGPVGRAAAGPLPVIEENAAARLSWAPFGDLARAAKVAASWSVPVLGPGGPVGVITVLRSTAGRPKRDDLDLVTLYAGYAAGAIERDRLLEEVTSRNRVLETIREMLETLAGPLPVADGLGAALQSLRRGLQAAEVALVTQAGGEAPRCRAVAGDPAAAAGGGSPGLLDTAAAALGQFRRDDVATSRGSTGSPDGAGLTVTFAAPGSGAALVATWPEGPPPADATALLEDAAHSLRLALEREEAWVAHQEALALRRSRELQRGFLSRLSHELRTPLTAIRGYASSLLQPDVTWDGASQHRFMERIAAESARLGRLVDDLLDFSAIESGVLRLQRDWCDIPLVVEAAVACLPPAVAPLTEVTCAGDLPVVWADHDRLEQVFVNLLTNAFGHNPAGTRVAISAALGVPGEIVLSVRDDGAGMPPEVAAGPFEPARRRRTQTSGAGLGLSIARGIVTAHGGQLELVPQARGTCFAIRLPVEAPVTTPRPAGHQIGVAPGA
ncbi:MAG TPA: ATP-binding cassette domain-containing protein [Streptosporangiaceae bacterium]|nr:ATP-binding cassette domain-containing protein [Streptosporangiaceae bacterium]